MFKFQLREEELLKNLDGWLYNLFVSFSSLMNHCERWGEKNQQEKEITEPHSGKREDR